MKFSNRFKMTVAALALAAAGSAQATITYTTTPAPGTVIPGVATFQTTGAMMDGMSITANFTGGFSETRLWADTGAVSGGVTGTGWSLSQSGDTYSNYWSFDDNRSGSLLSLVLNGNTGFTLFDRTNPGPGTPGSSFGWDFSSGSFDDWYNPNVTVNYSDRVALPGQNAVGDLWQVMTVNFGSGYNGDFRFIQDTDNDIRATQVPDPGMLSLIGLALAGLGFTVRKRKAVA
jgi:hypothetical protein